MTTRHHSRRLLTLVGLLVVVGAGVLYGQRDGGDTNPFAPRPNPVNEIGEKLDQLLAVVAPVGDVTLFTGFLRTNHHAACTIANVRSATPIVATIRMLNLNGGDVVPPITTLPIATGNSDGMFVTVTAVTYPRCEFSFLGSAKDVRATVLAFEEDRTVAGALDAY